MSGARQFFRNKFMQKQAVNKIVVLRARQEAFIKICHLQYNSRYGLIEIGSLLVWGCTRHDVGSKANEDYDSPTDEPRQSALRRHLQASTQRS